MRRFVALPALITLSAIMASCQVAPPAETWGEPVKGVQLHLALAKTGLPPTPPGQLPDLEMQIRNQGSSPVTVNSDRFYCPDIEIDGVWYRSVCVVTGSSGAGYIPPGSRSDVVRTRPNGYFVRETDKMIAMPVLSAGPHSVRVRNSPESVYTVRADSTTGFVQVWLSLLSNRITIDIPESTMRRRTTTSRGQ